jgi:cytochrome c-type biogenesis protein CcmH/NrfF
MILICTALCYVACAAPVSAQRIEGQVWSPYCPGRLLIDCPTRQADDLRAEISRRLDRGQSADDVMRWIRLNFGNEAIARPAGHDTILIWSFPVVLFVLGTALLIVLIRRWTKGRTYADSQRGSGMGG